MQYPEENVTYKNNVKKAIYIFMAVMLFLTLFSKTINNLVLPRVITVTPQEGTLTKEVRAEGIVEGKDVYSAYTKDSFQVEEVKVQIGETVSEGQLLMVIDTQDLERELFAEHKILAQKEITLEILRAENERETAAAKDNLDLKRRNAAIVKKLYETGADSKVNLENVEADLRAAERAYNAALGVKGKPNLDIQKAGLDIQLQQSKIAAIQDELKTVEHVVAPEDGVITGLNCSKGAWSDPAKPLYVLTSRQGGFALKVTIDSTKADYFKPGDEVEVSIPASEEGQIKGKIQGIRTTSADESSNQKKEQKEVVIDLESPSLRGGEHAGIDIKKETRGYELLIPNEAVRKDKNQTCVYILQEKKGALGKEYYIQKVSIFCADADDSKTAVSKGLMWNEKIVCSSDKMVFEGDRVKLGTDNNNGGL